MDNQGNKDCKYCVYYHRNSINGKYYIGQTGQRVEIRWANGRGYAGCTYFNKAIEKYGWDCFEHVVIESGLSKQEADERQDYWIRFYDSCNPKHGYNIRSGGAHGGHRLEEETKRKISEANRGHVVSQESRKKISNALMGKKQSQETKEKRKQSMADYFKSHPARPWRPLPLEHKQAIKDGVLQWWKENPKKIVCVETGQIFVSQRDASDKTGTSYRSLNNCLRGVSKSAGGYHWEYVE